MESNIPFIPELEELVEIALSKVMGPEHKGIVTKGLLILEVLEDGEDQRSVSAIQVGRQGTMTPWEAIGIMKVAEIQMQLVISHSLHAGLGGHDEEG